MGTRRDCPWFWGCWARTSRNERKKLRLSVATWRPRDGDIPGTGGTGGTERWALCHYVSTGAIRCRIQDFIVIDDWNYYDISLNFYIFLFHLPRIATDCHGLPRMPHLAAKRFKCLGARQESMREQSQKLQAASEKSQDLEAGLWGVAWSGKGPWRKNLGRGGYGGDD